MTYRLSSVQELEIFQSVLNGILASRSIFYEDEKGTITENLVFVDQIIDMACEVTTRAVRQYEGRRT
jgi:hypothetical protein